MVRFGRLTALSRKILQPLRRPPAPPPTQADIDQLLGQLHDTAQEFTTGTFEILPQVPAERMTWYDAELTWSLLSLSGREMQRRLPPGSVERRRLGDAIEALQEGFDQLPDKPRVSD